MKTKMTPKQCASSRGLRILLAGSLLLLSASTSAVAAEKRTCGPEAAGLVGGASKVSDLGASGRSLIGLSKPGQAMKFTGLPAASKLAIRSEERRVGKECR